MTSIHLAEMSPIPGAATRSSDPLVIGAAPSEDGPVLVPPGALPAEDEVAVTEALRALGATGKAEEIQRVVLAAAGADAPLQAGGRVVVVVGLGAPDDRDAPYGTDAVRRAAGAAARALAGSDSAVCLLALVNGSRDNLAATAAAVTEGMLLGAYSYRAHRTPGPEVKAPVDNVVLLMPASTVSDVVRKAVAWAETLSRAVLRARDWVNAPPNTLFPEGLASAALALAQEHGLEVEVLDETALREAGYGGITAVGQGSANPPRLVRLTWRPEGAQTSIALVGKGITFDSGGLSLKPPKSMVTMKTDMAGAAAVLAATVAVAELAVPVEVTAWLALAENMPSGTAQRPGDVITMYGGRTVEVLNTDAEGRLVLADAVARASEEAPDHLVVVATLTGAQGVALGVRTCGVMGDEGLRARVVTAGDTTGEPIWPMPLPEDVRSGMDSDVADIANIGDGSGGMLAGGLFLKEFVPDGASWAHIDIARPSFHEKGPYGWTAKGATGVPVRTLVALTAMLASDRPAPGADRRESD